MTGNSKIWTGVKDWLLRPVMYLLGLFLLLIFSLIIIIQIPQVQNRVVDEVAQRLTEKLKYPISIDRVRVSWLDTFRFSGVRVMDKQGAVMIAIDDLVIDYDLFSLLDNNHINIDRVRLREPEVRIIRHREDSIINISDFVAAIQELTRTTDTTSQTTKYVVVNIMEAEMSNGLFAFRDETTPAIEEGFDYQHFSVDRIFMDISDFMLVADSLEAGIRNMRGVDRKTGLAIKRLDTDFMMSEKQMQLAALDASVGNSHIADSIAFLFNSTDDLSDFNYGVRLVARLDSTVLSTKDLALFAPQLSEYDDYWRVSGLFSGKVSDFEVQDLAFRFGNGSSFEGYLSMSGLPDFEETFIEADLKKGMLFPGDIVQYTGKGTYPFLKKFGTVRTAGKFFGFPSDFVANSDFSTALGRFSSDINLKLNGHPSKSTYEGSLRTSSFDLGALLDERELVQQIAFNGKVSGKGLTREEAILRIDAKIPFLGIKGYRYRNITTNATLSKQLFNGYISVQDSNLIATANGEIDLRKAGSEVFKINANLRKSNFSRLGLTDKSLHITTDLNLNFTGMELDNIYGDMTFLNSHVQYQERDLYLDTLLVQSQLESGRRRLRLSSELADVLLDGDYTFSALVEDIPQLIREYRLPFENDSLLVQNYYDKKEMERHLDYDADFEIRLKNINPLVEIFLSTFYLSPGTLVEGRFHRGYTSVLNINTEFDTLQYEDYKMYGAEVELNTSKIADSSAFLASAYVLSSEQQIGTYPPTSNFFLEGIWSGDRIKFSTEIDQAETSNSAELNGDFYFLDERFKIVLDHADINILNTPWVVSKDNSVYISRRDVIVNDLTFEADGQSISFDGEMSDSLNKTLNIIITDLQLAFFGPLIDRNITGITNAHLEVKDVYDALKLNSNVRVDSLYLDNFLIGNIDGYTIYDTDKGNVQVNYTVNREYRDIMSIIGSINPLAENDQLNLTASLNDANLIILEPFLQEVVSNFRGTAKGDVKISGRFDYPILKGDLRVVGGGFKVNYLGTEYTFNDRVYLSENEIGFKNLRLNDRNGNYAIVTKGGIFHDGFADFLIDLKADLYNFQVLNTTEEDNSLYYGTANVSGDLQMFGPVNDMKISANAQTGPNTKIYIPLSDDASLEEQSFISFVKPVEDTLLIDQSGKVDLSGIAIDFDLDITNDASVEIIFDKRTGDIIRGEGLGNIELNIDTRGDFTMFGRYEITRGTYNFTLFNLINKQFEIQAGSSISWYGDPYAGQLDVTAQYIQSASLLPILTNLNDTTPELRRRYPVVLNLHLTDDLLAPEFSFDIDIVDYPNIQSGNFSLFNAVQAFKQEIAANEQELNKQVASLLALKQLSPLGNSAQVASAGNNSVGNISEFITNQLSYWASQVDENFEINIDLNGLSADALNALQLRLSYTFLEGKLRVTRAGGFTNTQNEANFASVAGEWTIEYIIDRYGRFRIKMYNRNNQNVIAGGNQGNGGTTSAGVSFKHTETFDRLSEIIERKRQEEKLGKELKLMDNADDDETPEEDDSPRGQPTSIKEEEPLATPEFADRNNVGE